MIKEIIMGEPKKDWKDFYFSRVNSERYYNHFKNKYRYFLDLIVSEGDKEIFEAGCGIGMVSLILKEKGIKFSGIDLCPRMVEMANINTSSSAFKQGDMFEHGTDKLTVTHGVLEHFEDDMILKALELYPNSVHYVPLDKYEIPSFGDERLLPFEYWMDMVKPKKGILFNDGYDLAFKI